MGKFEELPHDRKSSPCRILNLSIVDGKGNVKGRRTLDKHFYFSYTE